MSNQKVLLTDLDNTIYDWVDYFVPCFNAMLAALVDATGHDERCLIDDFRSVFKRHHSVEYSFSVQELRICRGLNEGEVARLIEIARTAFSEQRKVSLRAYAGVPATLDALVRHGYRIVGVTNSPLFQAAHRLEQLEIDQYFYGLAAWRGALPRSSDPHAVRAIQKSHAQGWATKIGHTWGLSRRSLKPSPAAYEIVIRGLETRPSDAFAVGDSLAKDVAPAQELGAIGVWAQYGQLMSSIHFDRLLQITHWTSRQVTSSYDAASSMTPSHTIEKFENLVDLLT